MVEEAEVRVMGGEPRARVEPEMRYWDWPFGRKVSEPMVRGTGVVPVGEGRREVRGP